MNLPPHSVLRAALARHGGGEAEDFDRAARLEEDLQLDPLDLTLIVLRLEEEESLVFPLGRLQAIRTVGELDDLVERWIAQRRLSAA